MKLKLRYLAFIIALILIPCAFYTWHKHNIPLSATELNMIEQELRIIIPDSASEAHVFFRKAHQAVPHIHIKTIFAQSDLNEFLVDCGISPERPIEPRADFMVYGVRHPEWLHVRPLLLSDRVYDRGDGFVVLIRPAGEQMLAYVEIKRTSVNDRLQAILTKYPFRDAPFILGPGDVTGIREWRSQGVKG